MTIKQSYIAGFIGKLAQQTDANGAGHAPTTGELDRPSAEKMIFGEGKGIPGFPKTAPNAVENPFQLKAPAVNVGGAKWMQPSSGTNGIYNAPVVTHTRKP